MNLSEFIIEHENDDPAVLVLQRDRWPGIDAALAAECIKARRKLRTKVPEWHADPSLVFPSALSAEQCSSTSTARYKAEVASPVAGRLPLKALREEQRARPCPARGTRSGHCSSASIQAVRDQKDMQMPVQLRIADLTGGLGVDTWQFSKSASAVLYNEMNPLLLEAARSNFARLGCNNVEFSNLCIDAATLPGLLDSFKPDLVFADPARRDTSGRKVFLPEDCSPDMLALQDIILGRGCILMTKLSPMADISLMLRKFHCVRELHIVEADGECKELLLVQEPDGGQEPGGNSEPVIIITVLDNQDPDPEGRLHFLRSEESAAAPTYIFAPPTPGQLLFEPGPALMKSGAFNLLSSRFGLRKFGPSAHLYCTDTCSASDIENNYPLVQLARYGKWFVIQEVAMFSKSSMRDFASRWPDADVTARALPVSSDELRAKLNSLSGKIHRGRPDGIHIYGIGSSAGRILLACHPMD